MKLTFLINPEFDYYSWVLYPPSLAIAIENVLRSDVKPVIAHYL